jgi:CHAT domain-containing protein/tetratricopeptide (TPR) repeat protein
MQRRFNCIHLSLALVSVSLLPVPVCAQESRWKELDAQIEQLQKQGKTAEAAPLAQEAVRLAETTFGPEHANTATALQKLGMADMTLGQYPEAKALLQRALTIREKTFGPEAAPLAEVLNGLGQLSYCEGQYSEAEALFKRALAIGEKVLGPELPDLAESLNDLGIIYDSQGRYAEAEQVYRRALAIREKVFGPEHASVAETFNNLAILYEEQSRYAESEELYKHALAINEKDLGPDDPQVAIDLGNLALLYNAESRYKESEQLYKRALAINEKVAGPDHPDVALVLSNLENLYREQGRYGEAETLSKRALAIYEKVLGPDHPNVATVLNNLGDLYQEQGRYQEAEALSKRALAINEKALGPDNPIVAYALNNLAVLYVAEGRYKEAEPLYTRALAIREKALGPEHPDVAGTMTNLAVLEVAEGRYEEAEPLYKRGLAIREKTRGPNHPDVATDLSNLAALYAELGRYSEAEPLDKRALEIEEKALGADHPRVATDLYCLSKLYYAEGHYDQAEHAVLRSLDILRRRFEYSFAYMSEKDRLQFLGTVRNVFTLYFSLALTEDGRDAAVAGRTYDLLLWQKGLVSTSVATLRAQVAASGDPQAIKIFEDLTAKKSQSSRLVATRPTGWQEARTRADTEANDLEQQLARRVSSFADQKNLASATWLDVQKALKPGDAAVEFVRFPFHDGKQQTDKTYYIALVIRPENPQPALIRLGEAHEIEGAAFSAFHAEVGIGNTHAALRAPAPSASPWRSLYDSVWKPLEAPLADAKRVYVSLDGALNEIPVGVLQGSNGRRVMEKYDFRMVSSTRDLLRARHRSTSNTATLVGNPRFLLSDEEQRIALNHWHGAEKSEPAMVLASAVLPGNPASGALSRDATQRGTCNPPPPEGGVLCPLPGTATEVQSIGDLLRRKHWLVSDYQGNQALEEVVKKAANPRVLHLATHGFFLSDQQVKLGESLNGQSSGLEDPMMRSGLFFAGADRTLNSQPTIEGVETGVLTAYEATALNLQGTELVVLSACETGRGQVQNGEGVFGLGRALQEAGAESVLMSLWSVPDRETQELMTLFYKNWLTGMDKPEALRRAQITERDRVKDRYGEDLPYYWGAFILVGR